MTSVNRIKDAVDIVELIKQKYILQGSRRYYRAEQHDSLVVDAKYQSYTWYSRSGTDGKNERGDVIDWVGRYCLNYETHWNSSDPALFKEAVTWLANYAGIEAPQFRSEDVAARAKQINRYKLMERAADHYRDNFNQSEAAKQYTTQRGFTPETATMAGFGYSTGTLQSVLRPGEYDLAVELGLLGNEKRRYWDAIPEGYLVYIHTHKGKVEYMAGRSLTEKKHKNLYSTKKMYWSTWCGYHRPIVIVEGQADADSIGQLGANALALCGVNLTDFDPEWLRLFSRIYIWPDGDQLKNNTAHLLADALGPLIRVITPAGDDALKDANDFLKTGATPADLQALLDAAPEFLETEIERLSQLNGADLYDEMSPLFTRLIELDAFAITRYRSRICKELNISQSDFSRYLKAAKGTLSDDEEEEFAKGGQYTTVDGWTVLKRFTDDGKQRTVPLANASIKIIEEVVNDDGSNDPSLDFVIGGELATGQTLPKITLPAAEYDALKWSRKWGSRFILSAGRSVQDHFRAAVQHLSGTPYRRTIYTHTGWRKIGDEWAYLSSSGALGANGKDNIQVDMKMGRPDTNMVRYTLPQTPENVAEAMQRSLNFWYIADLSITVPIWAGMWLAPLNPFVGIDFGMWIHGRTGSMKSSIVAAALAHHGQWQGFDAKIFLPANFVSTGNSILMSAFQAKDVPLVIDDFAPGATQKEIRERDQIASSLLRTVGNKAARSRMKDGRNFQADFPPRCLAIVTAEDLPPTASIMARGIGVRVHLPDKGDPKRAAIEARLKQAQTEDSYYYPHAMSAYILWLKRHWDTHKTTLPVIADEHRDRVQNRSHSRLSDAFGKLMAAIDTALYFALDCGAITQSQADERKQQAFEALGLMTREHGEAVDAVDACHLFQEVLREQLDARQWYLSHTEDDNISASARPNLPIGAVCAGYYDEAHVYILSKTVTDAMKIHQSMGQPFPVGKNTLYKRLIEKKWLIPGDRKTSTTIYIRALSASPRVLRFRKNLLLPDYED
ncbi:MAG: hypothetical protein AAF485_05085 [Chloroflexota bacterium]